MLNENKTNLNNALEYACNPDKNEQHLFECFINCDSKETAYQEMIAVKEQFGKTEGVQGYHIIQSFMPDEVSPELANEIGLQFTEQCFGERYQAVIGTHLDRRHLHNHIIVNSVSFIDGSKYRNNFKDYFQDIRGTSDTLCRKYGLSIINPSECRKRKHYAEWQAEQKGKPTWRGLIREDVDKAIRLSPTYAQFIHKLREWGYQVKTDVKFIAVKPPGKERFVRLRSLGDEYSEEAIRGRIAQNREQEAAANWEKPTYVPICKRYGGRFRRSKGATLKGFRALYFRYLYQMGILRKRQTSSKRTAFLLREDLLKLDSYTAQAKLLFVHRIDTLEQLHERQSAVKSEIEMLMGKRAEIRVQGRKEGEQARVPELAQEQAAITVRLKRLRIESRHYDQIEQRVPMMRKNLNQEQIQQKTAKKRDDPQR